MPAQCIPGVDTCVDCNETDSRLLFQCLACRLWCCTRCERAGFCVTCDNALGQHDG